MAEGPVLAELLGQCDFWWERMFRPRIAGLGDDEYYWEPAPGCLSVRAAPDGRYLPDREWPEPYPPRFTTIAWRMCHMGAMCHGRASGHFGDGSVTAETMRWPRTAGEAVAFVDDGWRVWREGIGSLGEDGLWREVGPREGQYRDSPFIGLVLHMNRELIHHGAEVALLRDLYWATHRDDPIVQACLRGDRETVERLSSEDPEIIERTVARHPDLMVAAVQGGGAEAVRLLVELGFDVNPPARRAPVHEAIARGDLELVRYLVEHGADTSTADATYGGNALVWAEFLKRSDIVDYLKEIPSRASD